MLTADLHTHTIYSHGTGTVEDNVRAAIEKALDKKLNRIRKSPADALKRQADEFEQAVGTLFDTLRNLPGEFASMLHIDK